MQLDDLKLMSCPLEVCRKCKATGGQYGLLFEGLQEVSRGGGEVWLTPKGQTGR